MTYSPSDPLIESIYKELLAELELASVDPHNPVVVYRVSPPWQLLGAGNYAAVFHHPNYPDRVVKVYAPGRPGLEEEVEVYRRLGSHPAFSACFFADQNFLVLKRLYGTTLYDCVHRGIPIPLLVIRDIDQALDYARQQGLYPHDVHGRNVMMANGRGLVVDVSDFLRPEYCAKWQNLKQAYFWFYRPLIAPLRLQVPYVLLDGVRASYRLFCRVTSRLARLKPGHHSK
ncbi:MAG: serine/threonine protein kinase [Leptolyngbyaceae cyanobacterium bins.349]|nr:serine/threonine protein kinase [Leptolyngbyaceae cyanobacterium bins.349]